MTAKSERVTELGMGFGAILDAPIDGVSDVDLALEVGKAKNLLDQLQVEYDEYVENVRAECLRQDTARQQRLASVGLTGLPPAKVAKVPGKRGRKSKAEKEAEAAANAENEAAAFEEDELASGNSALLDAE